MLADIRFALRQISRYRAFSGLAILTLALGIGANTAIFSVIHGALIQPLPYPEPDRLVGIFEQLPNGHHNAVSGGAFKDWRDHSSSFTQLAIAEKTRHNVTGAGTPELLVGMQVTSEYLDVLGVRPSRGRGFAVAETTVGGEARLIVLTDSLWRSRFGGREDILGDTVYLDQTAHTVVGVLPPRALPMDDVTFLTPLVVDGDHHGWGRAGHWKDVIGRLAPGKTAPGAQAELRGIKERLADDYPVFKEDWSVAVQPLQKVLSGDTRPTLMLLLATVGLVLLIACANVSNLLLARGKTRRREMAIRASLGAHRWRMVRQMLVESLVLALLGCGFGLLLAEFGVDLLAHMFADQLPRAMHPDLNSQVLLFSLLSALLCGVLFGILPALSGSRVGPGQDLKERGRGSTSGSRGRSQSLLVVSEVALSLVLLVGAGLLLRSFVVLLHTDPGFEPRGVLAVDLSLPEEKYPQPQDRQTLIETLRQGLQRLPGVDTVAAVSALPLSQHGRTEMASRADREETFDYLVQMSFVGADYFEVMGMSLLRGRPLSDTPTTEGPRELLISSDIAAQLYAGEEALGQSLRLLDESWQIVGIVPPVRHFVLDAEPMPNVYLALGHSLWSGTSFAIRTQAPPTSLIDEVRAAVLAVDPEQPIANVRTLEQSVERSLAPRRMTLSLLAAFATIAVLLAAIGIYGVIAYTVSQRRRELSIRCALGANRHDVVRLILRGGLRPSLLGIVIGLGLALVLARLLDSMLYGVRPYDLPVFLGAASLLTIASAVSILLPAHRASRPDVTEALRAE